MTKILTKLQKKANSRNQLFRQIHGYSLIPFIQRAIREDAITDCEQIVLREITDRISFLKGNQFESSKELGLHPRRRCHCCNNIAHWKITIFGIEQYCCNKHKEEAERDNKQNNKGEWMVTSILHIDSTK